jgi:transcriptional regulator GlxA family with amidase domain
MTVSLTLSELGRMVGSGERTLSRLFHNEIGMGFTVWRNQLRLIAPPFCEPKGEQSHVSTACGFSSPSAFISSFQAAFGRTPGFLCR